MCDGEIQFYLLILSFVSGVWLIGIFIDSFQEDSRVGFVCMLIIFAIGFYCSITYNNLCGNTEFWKNIYIFGFSGIVIFIFLIIGKLLFDGSKKEEITVAPKEAIKKVKNYKFQVPDDE